MFCFLLIFSVLTHHAKKSTVEIKTVSWLASYKLILIISFLQIYKCYTVEPYWSTPSLARKVAFVLKRPQHTTMNDYQPFLKAKKTVPITSWSYLVLGWTKGSPTLHSPSHIRNWFGLVRDLVYGHLQVRMADRSKALSSGGRQLL